jgi:hypothetical protein
MAKVQGEGDYEAGRRYNTRTRTFVAKAGAAATRKPAGGVDNAALRKAKAKSRAGVQDARDAGVFRTLEAKRNKSSSRARSR